MPMIVETALITRKAKNAEFNTDSINASGKTWPREAVHDEKGIKAVGAGRDVPYYVLAGSAYKGTAESAADLFKSCTDIFAEDMSNCSEVISEFYTSFSKVLNEAGYSSEECDIGIFCAHDNIVHIGKSGQIKLYRFSGNEFSEVIPQMFPFQDNKASYGVAEFGNSVPDDIFIMMNSSVAEVLPADLIKNICRSVGGDIKKLVSVISAQADKYNCKGAMSAIVIKITETSEPAVFSANDETVLAASSVNTENNGNGSDEQVFSAAVIPGNPEEEKADETNEDNEERTDALSRSGKIALGIVIGIFVILLVVLGILAAKGIARRSEADITTTEITTEESTAETTTEPETAESTTEQTTAETTEESTTEESTTRRQSVNVLTTSPRTQTTAENTTERKTETEPTRSETPEEPTSEEPSSEEESATVPEETTKENTEEPSSERASNTEASENEPSEGSTSENTEKTEINEPSSSEEVRG